MARLSLRARGHWHAQLFGLVRERLRVAVHVIQSSMTLPSLAVFPNIHAYMFAPLHINMEKYPSCDADSYSNRAKPIWKQTLRTLTSSHFYGAEGSII